MITAIQAYSAQGVASHAVKANVRFGDSDSDSDPDMSVGDMRGHQCGAQKKNISPGYVLSLLQNGPKPQDGKLPSILVGRGEVLSDSIIKKMTRQAVSWSAKKRVRTIADAWKKEQKDGTPHPYGIYDISNDPYLSRVQGVMIPSTGSGRDAVFPWLELGQNPSTVEKLAAGVPSLGLTVGDKLPTGQFVDIPYGTVLRLASKKFKFVPTPSESASVASPAYDPTKHPEALFALLRTTGGRTEETFTFARACQLLGNTYPALFFGTRPNLRDPQLAASLRQRLESNPSAQALFEPAIKDPNNAGQFVLANYQDQLGNFSDIHLAAGVNSTGQRIFTDTSYAGDGIQLFPNSRLGVISNKDLVPFPSGQAFFLSNRAQITFPDDKRGGDNDENPPAQPKAPSAPKLILPEAPKLVIPPARKFWWLGEGTLWNKRKPAKTSEPENKLAGKTASKPNGVRRKRVRSSNGALATRPPRRKKPDSVMA